MNLNEAQQQAVRQWIEEGVKLSDLQKRLEAEFGVHMTYMEVRFLVDDLKLTPKDEERPKEPAIPAPETAAKGAPKTAAPGGIPGTPAAGPGSISVSIDQVTRPGAMVSGKVTFSDGHSAEWHLDQYGRLGLAPQQEGYRPSQQDIAAFQSELQRELQRSGF